MTAGLRLVSALCSGLAVLAGPGLAQDGPGAETAVAPDSGPQRRDCPAEAADPGLSGSDLAQQLQRSIAAIWQAGGVLPGTEGAKISVRLCPSKDPRAPLDVFIMDYQGPEGEAQQALFGALMAAIRRVAAPGRGFEAVMLELGRGDPDLVTLDLEFIAEAHGSGAAP